MLKPRFPTFPIRLLLACVFCVALAFGSSARGVLAAPLQAVPGHTVTIPAGGTGTIQVQAISLSPGSSLGTGALPLATQPLATDRVRTALFHGIDWGYTDSAPYQVALAVWWVQDSNWLSSEHEAAERIGTAALSSAGTPSWNPEGVNLLSLAQSGQATVSPLTLIASAQNASLGSGTIQVTNNSVNSVTIYLPYGTVFGGPAGRALVWATGTGGPAPETTPTSAAQVTATIAPSTSTPEPVAPTATQPRKGSGQPPAATTVPSGQTKGNPSPVPSNTPAPPSDTATPLPPATATPPPPPIPAPVDESPSTAEGGAQGETQQPSAPPSVPPGTKGEETEETSESVTVPTGDAGEGATQPDDSTQAAQGGTPSGGAAAVQPDGKVYGPPLPPTPTPTAAGDTFPEPVSTTFVPQAIDTSEPTELAPNPQSTNEVPVPPAQSTNEVPVPILTNVPTTAPFPTAEPTKEEPGKIDPGTGDGSITGDGTEGAPTESVPTPAPTPVPQPITDGSNDGNGTVDATSGDGGTSDQSAGGSPASGDGAPPQINPSTGGGRSDLTIWLGVASALMILGGWTLRRTARVPATAPVRNEQQ